MNEILKELTKKIDALKSVLKIEERKIKIADLEKDTLLPNFWNDNKKAQKILKNIDIEKCWVIDYSNAKKTLQDAIEFEEMLEEEDDDEIKKEALKSQKECQKGVANLEMRKMLGGPDDSCNAMFEIHPGAGGTESQDWANMILRMYTKYFEKCGYEVQTMDLQPGDEVGIKSVILEVRGSFTYGYLKAEIGVHRLVRISPFDSNARRHTSFASVHVLPILEDSEDLKLADSDIRIDTYRASGAGGQHINKTDSAVRMTHLPTNIVAQCQTQRSQIKNRESCLKLLKVRVSQFYKDEEERKRDASAAEKKKIEWGSQIRSYVMHPYNMVKDHRTNFETSNTGAVLDGDLDDFVKQYLLLK